MIKKMLQNIVKKYVEMNPKEFSQMYKSYVETANSFNIDFSNACPLECPLCARTMFPEMLKTAKNMSFDSFLKLVNKSKHISLCGNISDPIYSPIFEEVMQYMNTHQNISLQIHTNGTRKKLDWWKKVYELSHKNVYWIFGLDGTDQETANIYRVNTRYDEVIEVMKLGVSMGVNVEWQFIIFKHNEHQLEDLKKIASQNNIKIRIIKSNRWIEQPMKQSKIELPSENLYVKGKHNQKQIIKIENI